MNDYINVRNHILNWDRSDFDDLIEYVTIKNNGYYEENEGIINDYIDGDIDILNCMILLSMK